MVVPGQRKSEMMNLFEHTKTGSKDPAGPRLDRGNGLFERPRFIAGFVAVEGRRGKKRLARSNRSEKQAYLCAEKRLDRVDVKPAAFPPIFSELPV